MALLDKLDHPERRLPPVVHVAGTNGKGSTCAFLRAIGEASGWRVHVFTSPHLVRFNERIRLAGQLVEDDALDAVLDEVEQVNAGAAITEFEIITAAAFLLFARVPADLCVIEVGLGGRYDATNLLPLPAACAIASISIDHREFLGDTLGAIAWEKAGIIKPGGIAVTGRQKPEALEGIRRQAASCDARLLTRDEDWTLDEDKLIYADRRGSLPLPSPSLPGAHQIDNAGLAVAALRASGLLLPDAAWGGIAQAEWPARMQRLQGYWAEQLPPDWEIWLDGGHNPGAGEILAGHLTQWRRQAPARPIVLIVGMKQSKDASAFLRPLLPFADRVFAVAEIDQHLALPIRDIVIASGGVAQVGPDIAGALQQISRQETAGRVLICGSLYLAGIVLRKAEDDATRKATSPSRE